MKILVTGAFGFLGRHIIPKLEEYGHHIKKFGTTQGDYKYDITAEIPQIQESFDAVVHLAGKAHSIPKNEEEVSEFYNINVTGTQNICKSLAGCLPKHFIYISTVAVYGLDKGTDITETEPLNGSTPYATSKILAEKFLIQWAKDNNVILTILRPSLIAGHGAPGNLGSLEKMISKKLYFNIDGGKARKSVVWAEDFADIISIAINKNGGIFNVADNVHPTFGQIAYKIAQKYNIEKIPNLPFRWSKLIAAFGNVIGSKSPLNSEKLIKITSSLTFSNEKILKEFGWHPTNVLEKL